MEPRKDDPDLAWLSINTLGTVFDGGVNMFPHIIMRTSLEYIWWISYWVNSNKQVTKSNNHVITTSFVHFTFMFMLPSWQITLYSILIIQLKWSEILLISPESIEIPADLTFVLIECVHLMKIQWLLLSTLNNTSVFIYVTWYLCHMICSLYCQELGDDSL